MKSRWLRAVKNHSKASKIHSSGDMWSGHEKGKVRKTDGIKIEANAKRYTFVWHGTLSYHLVGLLDTIDTLCSPVEILKLRQNPMLIAAVERITFVNEKGQKKP